MKIKPFGQRILVLPLSSEYEKTEGGIVVDNDLSEGVIVEVSDELEGLFKVEDKVLYQKEGGQSQYYNGFVCLWLNTNSDVWGTVTEEEKGHIPDIKYLDERDNIDSL